MDMPYFAIVYAENTHKWEKNDILFQSMMMTARYYGYLCGF